MKNPARNILAGFFSIDASSIETAPEDFPIPFWRVIVEYIGSKISRLIRKPKRVVYQSFTHPETTVSEDNFRHEFLLSILTCHPPFFYNNYRNVGMQAIICVSFVHPSNRLSRLPPRIHTQGIPPLFISLHDFDPCLIHCLWFDLGMGIFASGQKGAAYRQFARLCLPCGKQKSADVSAGA